MLRRALYAMAFLLCTQTTASADYEKSRNWFNRLDEDARYNIQASLVLTGHYLAIVDSEFGPSTYQAIQKFEADRRSKPDGILTPNDLEKLRELASQTFGRFGFQAFHEPIAGLEISIPYNITPKHQSTPSGRHFTNMNESTTIDTKMVSKELGGFRELYDSMKKSRPRQKVTYSTINNFRFVITGSESNRYFYKLYYNTEAGSVGFEVRWAEENRVEGSIISTFLASHSIPSVYWKDDDTKPILRSGSPSHPNHAPSPAAGVFDNNGVKKFGDFIVLSDISGVAALTGEITPYTPLDFRRLLITHPETHTLFLNSPGGSVAGALLVAHEVRDRHISTIITEGLECYSACAFVFLAGEYREASGLLGVHQINSNTPDLVSAQLSLSDILDALTLFGVAPEVISIMLRTPPDEMYVFSSDEVANFGIAKMN